MSSSSELPSATQQTVQIPSLLTNSCRVILDAYGENLIHLRASGSIETTNRTMTESLREYGVSREQQTLHRISLEYEQLRGRDGPSNPLTPTARKQIFDEVETILHGNESSVKPDLAVTSFTIRITDERLQAVTPAQSSEFDLTFVADPAEQPIREPTKLLNSDRGLYSELGFNVTNLNLRTVIETETKYHQQSDGRYLSWRGPDDIRPRSPERLAVRINKHVLPDTFGTLKSYLVTDDRVLELVDESVDDMEVFQDINTSEADQ